MKPTPPLLLTRAATICIAAALTTTSHAATFLTPVTPYQQFADGPFKAPFDNGDFDYFHLETFEEPPVSGPFTVPGVTAPTGGARVTGPLIDSVDEDDTVVDGSGSTGTSFFSLQTTTILTFAFDAVALGGLPTHAGIVWTDVGFPNNGVDAVTLEAFDVGNASLGTSQVNPVGDGAVDGNTLEDTFLGLTHPAGISRIEVTMGSGSNDFEVDHLQFGRIVPEPTTLAILTLLIPTLTRRRR